MDSSRITLYGDDLYAMVRKRGIVSLQNKIIWLDYSCSGIEWGFEGTGIEIELVSKLCSDHYAWIEIGVAEDGAYLYRKYIINRHEQKIEIKKPGKCARIKLTLLKRTEWKYGDVGIKSISICGKLEQGQNDGRKVIEFIGDSISCGYGVEKHSLFHKFSTQYENGLHAFPYLLCKMMQKDYRIIASSGMGVWKQHKDYTGLSALGQYEAEARKEEDISHEKEFIIINMGTNDSLNIQGEEDRESFRSAYGQLLDSVRRRNPYAYIICAIGPMRCCLHNEIRSACRHQQEKGDQRIAFIRLRRKIWDGIGKGRHPTYSSQKRIAAQLYRFCMSKGEAGFDIE